MNFTENMLDVWPVDMVVFKVKGALVESGRYE
jgi:hypothetical protein